MTASGSTFVQRYYGHGVVESKENAVFGVNVSCLTQRLQMEHCSWRDSRESTRPVLDEAEECLGPGRHCVCLSQRDAVPCDRVPKRGQWNTAILGLKRSRSLKVQRVRAESLSTKVVQRILARVDGAERWVAQNPYSHAGS